MRPKSVESQKCMIRLTYRNECLLKGRPKQNLGISQISVCILSEIWHSKDEGAHTLGIKVV